MNTETDFQNMIAMFDHAHSSNDPPRIHDIKKKVTK